jgi:hypothetical protein
VTSGADERPSRTIQKMQEDLELFLNELGADVEVFRLLVQALFALVLQGHPDRERLFGVLKQGVLEAIARKPAPAHDPNGLGRRQHLTLMRAEAALLEIQQGLGLPTSGGAPSKSS